MGSGRSACEQPSDKAVVPLTDNVVDDAKYALTPRSVLQPSSQKGSGEQHTMRPGEEGKVSEEIEGIGAAEPTKACKACASKIPVAAKLCKECSRYQGGWRSLITISQTTLALLVALVSVIAAATPAITYAIFGNRSDLKAEFWHFDHDWAVFTISNPGDRAGFVDSATIYARQEGGDTGITLVRDGTDRVHPGDIFRLRFMLHPSQQDLALTLYKAKSSEDCYVSISLRQYDGSVTRADHDVLCRDAFASLASLHRAEILAPPGLETP